MPELVMEVPEAEWTSPAAKKATTRRTKPRHQTKEQNPQTGSPAKKHKPAEEQVRGVPEPEERLTVWYRTESMDMDGVGDEFAPDKDAPPTTAAEDAELLKECDKAIEEEPTLSGKEAKLQQWNADGNKSADKEATL